MDKASERLVKFMELYNLRQQDIINRTGLSSSTLSQWVNGSREPKHDKIGLIAQAYHVNPMWLMGFDNVSLELEWNPKSQEIETKSESDVIKGLYEKADETTKEMVRRILGYSRKE